MSGTSSTDEVDLVAAAPRLGQQPLLLVAEQAVGDLGEQLGVAQPAEHGARVERRPPRRPRSRGSRRRRAGRRRTPPGPGRGRARRGPGSTARRAARRPPAGSCRLRRPCDISCRRTRPSMPRSRVSTSSRQKTRNCSGLPGACSRAARRSSVAIRAEPLMSATAGSSWRVARTPSTTSPSERSATAVSPRLGQHPLDVAHEDAARADHQHAAALVAAPVGVEEVRRAVQRDHGLAGARAAADRDDARGSGARIARSCSAWMVATMECIERSRARDSCAISAPSPTIGSSTPSASSSASASASSSSSSTPTTLRTRRAQHPAAYDLARLGRGRLVEHRGRGRAPVDEQRVAVLVAQADPADVARLRGRRVCCRSRRPKTRPSWAASSCAIRRAAW